MARTPVLLVEEAGWTPVPIWTGVEKRKSHAPSGFEPITVQLVARRYTLLAHQVKYNTYEMHGKLILHFTIYRYRRSEARGGEVNGGTALLAGRSQVRFRMVSLEFFIDNPTLGQLSL